jgi:hypothetical protein
MVKIIKVKEQKEGMQGEVEIPSIPLCPPL